MFTNRLLIVALVITGAIAAWGIIDTSSLAATSAYLVKVEFTAYAWFIMLTVSFLLITSIFLAVSRYGRIKLGQDDDEPEFSTVSWLSMLFAAGMGVGLLYWGTAEPLTHYLLISEFEDPRSSASKALSMLTLVFAWAAPVSSARRSSRFLESTESLGVLVGYAICWRLSLLQLAWGVLLRWAYFRSKRALTRYLGFRTQA